LMAPKKRGDFGILGPVEPSFECVDLILPYIGRLSTEGSPRTGCVSKANSAPRPRINGKCRARSQTPWALHYIYYDPVPTREADHASPPIVFTFTFTSNLVELSTFIHRPSSVCLKQHSHCWIRFTTVGSNIRQCQSGSGLGSSRAQNSLSRDTKQVNRVNSCLVLAAMI
jgi:hypothetical protein